VTLIKADFGHWTKPVHPAVFANRSFTWYRSQLTFYLMRYNADTLQHVQNSIAQYFSPPSVDAHRPYVAVYVRRSDKVTAKEMSQVYTLEQYFHLFDADARQLNISNVYVNSEDEKVFAEYRNLTVDKQGYYRLLSIQAKRNVVFLKILGMSSADRKKVVLEFLTDLFIEANADLHVGTLTSNWCRLVDEIRLTLGKTRPFYTPENRYLSDM
jgi:hypothetical protein